MNHSLRWLPLLLPLALACGRSHGNDLSDARPALADGGAFLADGGPATDAGPGDCHVEAAGSVVGEGCFCSGPVALHEGHLYRQAVGIEVYRVGADGELAQVAVVDERPSASGGLAIAAGHLVSVVDFVEEAVRVHALDDPARPSEVARLTLPAEPSGAIAAHDGLVVVGQRDGSGAGVLTLLDLATPRSPRIAWSFDAPGAITAVAVGPRGVVALVQGELERRAARLLWLGLDGELGAERALEGRAFGRGLAFAGDSILLSGGEAQLLQRFRLEPGALRPDGALPADPARFTGGALLVRGDRALVGSSLTVVSLGDALVTLGDGAPTGDVGAIVAPPGPFGRVHVSNGNGVTPWAVRCE